jgi:hypothetical protein
MPYYVESEVREAGRVPPTKATHARLRAKQP